MSPMLRGEALPLPAKEIQRLRETLDEDHGEALVATPSGPLLMIRIPHDRPDFLRDLETAAETIPYRDLAGYRGLVLIGATDAMGVSIDMFRTLVEDRRHTESQWIAEQRVTLEEGQAIVTRAPQDPHRRLVAVFRVGADSVRDLDERHFDRVAGALPGLKRASPGGTRPTRAFLIAHTDHVRLDAGPFFTELEARLSRTRAYEERQRREELERARDAAVRAVERRDRATSMARAEPPPAAPTPRLDPPTRQPGQVRPATAGILDEIRHTIATRQAEGSADDRYAADARPSERTATSAPNTTTSPTAFRVADAHLDSVAALRTAFDEAGFKVRERMVVQGLPISFAAARPEGYPTRVLVSYSERVDEAEARRLLKVGRSVGVELLLVLADDVTADAERVALATSLKFVSPDRAEAIRFD